MFWEPAADAVRVKRRRKSLVNLVALLAAAVLVSQLGGLSAPSGDGGRSGSGAPEPPGACDGPPTATAVRRQAPDTRLAAWQRERPSNPAALARATLGVEAAVTRVADGAGSPPAQIVELVVCTVLDGDAAAVGGTIELVHLGDSTHHVVGDPFYSEGERYALFLEPAGEGMWQVVDRTGRHLLLPDGTSQPVA